MTGAQKTYPPGVDRVEPYVARVSAAGGRVVVPALDAQPAGRLAIVEAPGGATFGLWEAAERTGAQRINEPSAWAMSALRTRDLRAAAPFYASVFGWNVEPFDFGGGRAVLFRLPGYIGGLPGQPVPRDVVAAAIEDERIEIDHWSVDFWIDDVAAAVKRVEAGAGRVVVPPFVAPPFRKAVVADPGGAICTISELMLA
jgi:uncharacterized protein